MKKLVSVYEVIQRREDFYRNDLPEILKHTEPALFTQKEYLEYINPKGEMHSDKSYNFSIKDNPFSYIKIHEENWNKINTQKLAKNVTIEYWMKKTPSTYGYKDGNENFHFYTKSEKKEKGLPLYTYDFAARHLEENQIVGASQDEWGAALVFVAIEYRGLGIGQKLLRLYYYYYPSKASGGFTSFGLKQAKKLHSHWVRKYLANGIYSDMVKKGFLSKKRVKEITSSIQDVKRKKDKNNNFENYLLKYYGFSGNKMIYIEDSFIILYDTKFFDLKDMDLDDTNVGDLIKKDVIRSFISIEDISSWDYYDLFHVYSQTREDLKLVLDIALSFFGGLTNIFFGEGSKYGKKIPDNEIKKIYSIINTQKYSKVKLYTKNNEEYLLFKINKPVKYQELIKYNNYFYKKYDPYYELRSLLIETAEKEAEE